MAQDTALQGVLEAALRAARPALGPVRALPGDRPSDRFEAMLSEIGETVLERLLDFTAPGGRRLVLRVANRCVVALDRVEPASLRPGPDPDHQDTEAAGLARLFLRFVEAEGGLAVSSAAAPIASGTVPPGIATAAIRDARAALERAGAAAADLAERAAVFAHVDASARLRAFFLASSEFSRAASMSRLDGQDMHAFGTENLIPMEALSAGCAGQIGLNRSLLDDTAPGDRLILMGTGHKDLPSVCCVMDATALVVTTLDAPSVDEALAAWVASRDIAEEA